MFKADLPYSKTALAYYQHAKNNGKSLDQVKDALNMQVQNVKQRIEKFESEQEKYFDREKWFMWQFIIHEVVKIYSDPDYLWWKNRIQEVQWSRGQI